MVGSFCIIQFPTNELGDILGSIGITLPPERVYLGGHTDIEVHLQHNGDQMTDAMAHLFRDKNSLRMVNEVAKAVFHADWRVYERVEEKLKTDFYADAENLLRDAVDYAKYLKDKHRDRGGGEVIWRHDRSIIQGETRRNRRMEDIMAQINNKAVRSLSKLMEAGFDSEKAVMAMTMDDILALPGISVAEIGMINKIQKAVKANKVITLLCGGAEEVTGTADSK